MNKDINVSFNNLDQYLKNLNDIKKSLKSLDFINYIKDKGYQELVLISNQRLKTVENENYVGTYRNNHKYSVSADTITFWNDTMVDLSHLSEETQQKYAGGLSLAKIVEYGTGIVGKNSIGAAFAEDWEYDVNNHGSSGWYYVDKNGEIRWTKGSEGKLIYYQLKKQIEEKIDLWTNEYIEKRWNF